MSQPRKAGISLSFPGETKQKRGSPPGKEQKAWFVVSTFGSLSFRGRFGAFQSMEL